MGNTKKVLAFFGAFNPPTKAHVDLAKLAMEHTDNTGVVFVPAKASYILNEQEKRFAYSDEERVEMLRRIHCLNSWMDFTTHDILSKEQPRSYETLKWLRDECGLKPTLLVGADQFCDMGRSWKYVSEIANEFGIVCLTRSINNAEFMLANNPFYQKIAPHVTVVQSPKEYENISSTNARVTMSIIQERIAALRHTLPEEVFDYIKENHL